jgi:predicted transcriptional regulator
MAATTKATFTLDAATIARLRATADRLGLPKSGVVREAIREFSDRAEMLGESERRRMLEAFDRLVPAIPSRPRRDVDRELTQLRRARRAAGRRAGRGR